MDEDALKKLVDEAQADADLERKLNSLRKSAWELGVCPDCGGKDVKFKASWWHGTHAWTCQKCASGYSEFVPEYL